MTTDDEVLEPEDELSYYPYDFECRLCDNEEKHHHVPGTDWLVFEPDDGTLLRVECNDGSGCEVWIAQADGLAGAEMRAILTLGMRAKYGGAP